MSIRGDLEDALNKPGAKISKQRAGYSGGKMNAHCGICAHFRAPESCEIVAGRINPQAWCRYFEKKAR